MATASSRPAEPEEPVGEALARMRHARRLTGAELAARVGMSQPKISRIERGRGLPDPVDIGVIARALGASESHVRALMERAELAQNQVTDWRSTSLGLAGRQTKVADWEAAAAEIRDFEPTLLNGLLQQSGYARAVLSIFQGLYHPGTDHQAEATVMAAVAARLSRQQALADPDKSFRFVFTEAVLRNRVCPPADMLAQIAHLREQSTRPNVVLAIVPADSRVDVPPLHGFTLFDDQLVVIDIYNTGLMARGRNDVAVFREVFDRFERLATTDIDPILDRYEAVYLEQYRAR